MVGETQREGLIVTCIQLISHPQLVRKAAEEYVITRNFATVSSRSPTRAKDAAIEEHARTNVNRIHRKS